MPTYTLSPLGLPLAGDFKFRVAQGSVSLLGASLSPSDGWQDFFYPLHITSLPVAFPIEPNSSIETSAPVPEIPPDHALINAPELGRARVDEKILVCGAKGAGKSTFVRHLVNAKICAGHQVVLVDIDPGQPERGSPGCLSYMIGNLNFQFGISDQPRHSFFYGHLSPSHDIRKFLDLLAVIGNFIREISDHHVVVNSHGWLQGLGEFSVQCAVVHLEISSVLKISNDVAAPFWSTVDNPFLSESEISSLNDRKFRTQISDHSAKSQISAHELRWLRLACCLRTNFRSIAHGMLLSDFFDCHFQLRLPLGVVGVLGALEADDLTTVEVLKEALTGTIIGLIDIENLCLGLGFIVAVSEEHCVVLVSEKIDRSAVVRAERPSFNFSPRETNFFDKAGTGLKEGVTEELYWSSEILGGLESGARNVKNRQNLGRKRLQN